MYKPLDSGLSSLNMKVKKEEWLITMVTIVSMEMETSSDFSCNEGRTWLRNFRALASKYRYLKNNCIRFKCKKFVCLFLFV